MGQEEMGILNGGSNRNDGMGAAQSEWVHVLTMKEIQERRLHQIGQNLKFWDEDFFMGFAMCVLQG